MTSLRVINGHVSNFNEETWWGKIKLITDTEVAFHATMILQLKYKSPPQIGDLVQVVFSDTTQKEIASVRYEHIK